MTNSEQFELIGRTRANYKERKNELATLKAKAAKLAELAATLARGLQNPELIRWWSGTPLVGQRREHVILTTAMFAELSEQNCISKKPILSCLHLRRGEPFKLSVELCR